MQWGETPDALPVFRTTKPFCDRKKSNRTIIGLPLRDRGKRLPA